MRRCMFYTEPVDSLSVDLIWLADGGWNTIITEDNPAVHAAIRAQGMTPWTCLGAFTPPSDDPTLLCLDIDGERRRWFGSGCPNHPAIRESSLERHRRAAGRDDVAGVMLDGIRFASPASGLEAFFTCFCEHCVQKATLWGLDVTRMRCDTTAFYQYLASGQPCVMTEISGSPLAGFGQLMQWPGLIDWFWFRRQTITAFVCELSGVVHGEGKRIGAYLFSPCLAPIVGQDYTDLAPLLDVVAPMLYRNVNERNCIAPINTELHVIAEWADIVTNPAWVLALAGLPSNGITQRDELLTHGVSPEAVGMETERARALIGQNATLSPILWWDDLDAAKTVECALQHGADAVQVFRFINGIHERWQHVM